MKLRDSQLYNVTSSPELRQVEPKLIIIFIDSSLLFVCSPEMGSNSYNVDFISVSIQIQFWEHGFKRLVVIQLRILALNLCFELFGDVLNSIVEVFLCFHVLCSEIWLKLGLFDNILEGFHSLRAWNVSHAILRRPTI